MRQAGYDTAYIGKWHVDGHGRSSPSRERRQGFDYWKVLECTHDSNSQYYDGDRTSAPGRATMPWPRRATRRVTSAIPRTNPLPARPVLGTATQPVSNRAEPYRWLYDLRPSTADRTCRENLGRNLGTLAGYYAHCSALDACVGDLLHTIENAESPRTRSSSSPPITVSRLGPPRRHEQAAPSGRVDYACRSCCGIPVGAAARRGQSRLLLDAPDIMPTLLGLTGLPIPGTVEGLRLLRPHCGRTEPSDGAALIAMLSTHRGVVARRRRPGIPRAAHHPLHLRPRVGMGRGCCTTTTSIRTR